MTTVKESLIAARTLIERDGIAADAALDNVTQAKSDSRRQAYQAVRDAKPYNWLTSDWARPKRVLERFDRAIEVAE